MRTGKAQLIVRNLEPEIVSALRAHAARSGRSMEAEHREILRLALRPVRVQGTLKERLLRGTAPRSDARPKRKRQSRRG